MVYRQLLWLPLLRVLFQSLVIYFPRFPLRSLTDFRIVDPTSTTYNNHVLLTGLAPGTKYWYKVMIFYLFSCSFRSEICTGSIHQLQQLCLPSSLHFHHCSNPRRHHGKDLSNLNRSRLIVLEAVQYRRRRRHGINGTTRRVRCAWSNR